jgi:hypothetical protein
VLGSLFALVFRLPPTIVDFIAAYLPTLLVVIFNALLPLLLESELTLLSPLLVRSASPPPLSVRLVMVCLCCADFAWFEGTRTYSRVNLKVWHWIHSSLGAKPSELVVHAPFVLSGPQVVLRVQLLRHAGAADHLRRYVMLCSALESMC